MRDGFIITPSIDDVGAGVIAAATIGKAAEEGSAGTTTGLGAELGPPRELDPSAVRAVRRSPRTSAPKWVEHALGMVARRLGLDHRRQSPGALRPASSTADFTCADGTGVS